MTIVRRVVYDWRGNPIKVNDYDVTPCEYLGEQGTFVRDADAPSTVDVRNNDCDKETEHIQNGEYSRTLSNEFSRRIIQKG